MTTPKKRRDCGGVRTLAGMKDRCVINDETGCWEWQQTADVHTGGTLPRVWLADLNKCTTAMRGAWMLAGRRPLRKGEVIWRTCRNGLCCNPDHLKAGTKAQWGAWAHDQGHLRGDPVRAATARARRLAASPVTMETAQWARESQQFGADVAHALGVTASVVSRIRLGRTFVPVRTASIFAFGQAWQPLREAA